MGINYNPSIVLNGLVLALDAGNTKSYIGSGTTWTDLILNRNSGTLTNGPTYNNTSGGSIVFDGTNDNVSIGTNGFSFGSFAGTLSAWAKTRDRTSTGTIVSYGSSVSNQARFLGVGQSNFYFSGYGSSISASGISTDTWFNLVGVYDGTNASMYVNGALVSGPTARSWTTVPSNAGIGKNVNNSEYWKGDVAQVQIYNRALSAAEIQQNYNAFKSRYVNYLFTVAGSYWIATLGGASSDYGNAIAVDGSGNVYVSGFTFSSGAGNGDATIAKYNSSGTIQWQRTLGGADTDYGYGIAVDGYGNVYITGLTVSSGAGVQDVLIAKYDTSGAIQWQRTLGGASTDTGNAIAVDGSGNVYVTGSTTSSVDVLIAKYNTSGTIQWQRTLGGASNDIANGIAVDGSGNVYVTGYTDSSGAGGQDVLIAKYNTSGGIDWQRTLGGALSDFGYGIAVDGSGNVYVTGYTGSSGAGVQDVLIAKYNTSGAIQWQRTLGGTSVDTVNAIAVDGSGNVYITGSTFSSGAGNYDILIAKYNTSGTIQWQRTLGGASSDQGYGIAVDGSGNLYIIGSTTSSGAGGQDVLIAKLPADGSLTGTYGAFTYATSGLTNATSSLTAATSTLTASTPYWWIATLGGALEEQAYSIAVDGSGNVYVTGYTFGSGAGNSDVLIVKYDTSGTIQWQRTLGGANQDGGYGIAVDGSGNVYIAVYTGSSGAGNADVLIAKYDTSGTIQWQRTLGGASNDYGFGIAVDGSGNVYVTGLTESSGGALANVLIAKYNSSGTIQWQITLGGANQDVGYDIAVDGSGNAYIIGYTASSGAGNSDVLIVKYDTSGTIQWQRTLGGVSDDVGRSIAVDGSGNVYISGYTTSSGAGGADVLIAKYNTSGTIQWQRTLGGANYDYGYGIVVDGSGNVYITGTTSSSGAGSLDVLIVKYDTSGTIQWQRTLGGANQDVGYDIVVDGSGNVYITGTTSSSGAGSLDVLIAKLPADGGFTGTYGAYTYATSSLTAATPTLTAATPTLTSATPTLTSATPSPLLTSATSALTSTSTISLALTTATSGLSTATSALTSSIIVVG
jgi:uncharacterized delta-60 repeat protein